MIKRALLSVWQKDGIVDLCQFLAKQNIELISTGGTRRELEEAGLEVTPVSGITGTGSLMDGRLKTLDPKIFGGILADRNNDTHLNDLINLGGDAIDLVVVNFYPFIQEAVEKNLDFEKAIEFIDIGGPSMIRAAAKNYHSVIPLCSPESYSEFITQFKKHNGEIPLEIRHKYATEVFAMTARYEGAIHRYFTKGQDGLDTDLNINVSKAASLRYGENPHQQAAFYLPEGRSLPWEQHQGKALSYNNYADLESAITIALEFEMPACSIIKHANPCGFGMGDSPLSAYKRAITTDPVSYFGGIVGFNGVLDKEAAEELVQSFLECIIAPAVTDEAMCVFSSKKSLRIITIGKNYQSSSKSMRSVAGGFLVQVKDSDQGELGNLEIVTKLQPTAKQLSAMKLGWILVRYVKSNAIVFAEEKQLLGVGAGQMSRIDSVKIGIRKVNEAGLNLTGSTLASDAFFPFSDSIELAAEVGISAVIQPGGSIKDEAIIKRANELGLVMAFTKTRHFYH